MYAVGQIRPWGSIGKDGSLSPDSFRAWRMLLTAELGHNPTFRPSPGALRNRSQTLTFDMPI